MTGQCHGVASVRADESSAMAIRALCACAGLLLASAAALAQQRCDPDLAQRSVPTERFEDHGDGTVSDRTTKLMWTKCLVGQTWTAGACTGAAATPNWESAQRSAAAVNRDGTLFFNDWRLPMLRELATITERSCDNPRTNLAVFPATPAAWHWTASSRAGAEHDSLAYALSFGPDGVRLIDKSEPAHVRLVRSSQ
jgi:hypothetical protein